jgi:hypothetical protein
MEVDPYGISDAKDYFLMLWAQKNKNSSAYATVRGELIVVRGWDYIRRQLERQWKIVESKKL